MKSRAFRPAAAALCILILASTPVLGGPVLVSEVNQVLGVKQNPVSLRLQNTHRISDAVAYGVSGIRTTLIDSSGYSGYSSESPGSLLSGISVIQDQKVGVDIVDHDEVDGTICDCGEIFVAGTGFTKWPFFLLAAVPLIFIPRDDNPETPTPTPTPPIPTPTPTPTPEPATLLLLGSGLAAIGASLRRRLGREQAKSNGETKEG